ncbi:hypothetical protein SAMN05428983_4703 [Agrobacterium fabrum]|uniref:Uncharacterized protein n=1 Tax=Agrobacterium fabrum TaxID=1176649 RepID=A0A7Z7BRZ6_9HYPH|nr:hypothetical protein SAMN05428983_4703 [Agrobacterium fabrum]
MTSILASLSARVLQGMGASTCDKIVGRRWASIFKRLEPALSVASLTTTQSIKPSP